MSSPSLFRVDPEWAARTVARIVKRSGHPESAIAKVEINCGGEACLGWAILKTGERIRC